MVALDYARDRRQFGQPIASFGMIQRKLADMAAATFAMESATYATAALIDRGLEDYMVETAMLKLFASEACVRAANEAVQIHGGYGYIKEYPVEKFYRDAKLLTIGEGTSEIQKIVISRAVLK